MLLLLSQQRDDVFQVGDGSSVSPDLGDKEKQVERMGLTPDWIIQVTAFKVFQLSPPTPEQPFIKGLLDPCTNSMLAPNIPAEKLYDKVVGALCCCQCRSSHQANSDSQQKPFCGARLALLHLSPT